MKKLRPFHTHEELKRIYGGVYDPNRWPEHRRRIARTIEIAQDLVNLTDARSVADYSCGDGSVTNGLKLWHDGSIEATDIGKGDPPIDELVTVMPYVDLFICTETIEHLEAPWTVLEYVARRAKYILLSTPLDESVTIGNYEHYWSFTQWDVATILAQSGFSVDQKMERLTDWDWTYEYQIWTAGSEHFA